jgi:hypothetical protein
MAPDERWSYVFGVASKIKRWSVSKLQIDSPE